MHGLVSQIGFAVLEDPRIVSRPFAHNLLQEIELFSPSVEILGDLRRPDHQQIDVAENPGFSTSHRAENHNHRGRHAPSRNHFSDLFEKLPT